MKPYYQDSAVTIYHGDCREIIPTLGRFDLLLTDPPYDITAKGGGIGAKLQYLHDIEGFTDCGFDETILDGFDNWFCFCSISQLPRLIQRAMVRGWM